MANTSRACHPSYPPRNVPIKSNLVLRSKDGMLFHVHSSVLAISSSVFYDMMTLQRPPTEPEDDPIDVSESPEVLATLLDLIYPNQPKPEITTLVHLFSVAVAAEKYDMQNVFQGLQAYMLDNAKSHSSAYHCVATYAVARRFAWTGAVRLASDASLQQNLAEIISAQSLGDAMPLVDGTPLILLQDWHKERFSLVSDALEAIVGFDKAGQYVRGMSWTDLHVMMYEGPDGMEYGGDCDTFNYNFRPAIVHGKPWNEAIAQFKDRVRLSLANRPSGEDVRNVAFWQTWEFEGLNCARCGLTLIDKKEMQNGLLNLIERLPRYPGDTQKPIQY